MSSNGLQDKNGVLRKTTNSDRRFSSDPRPPPPPAADEETSPFLIGSLKFRRRAFQQRSHLERAVGSEGVGAGATNYQINGASKMFEMSAPPNRKLSVPVELCTPSSNINSNKSSPQIPPRQFILPASKVEPVFAAEGGLSGSTSPRGPSRNPSPNKRTSSGIQPSSRSRQVMSEKSPISKN